MARRPEGRARALATAILVASGIAAFGLAAGCHDGAHDAAGAHRRARSKDPAPAPGRRAARRCLGGHLDACVSVAKEAAGAGELREAGAVYYKACGAGSAAACLALARLYGNTSFHHPPYLPSATWLRRRAELLDEVHCRVGDGKACAAAAGLIARGFRGSGDERTDPKALWKRACHLGVRTACGKG